MRNRTRAREISLQILYQLDLREEELREHLDDLLLDEEEPEEVIEFSRGIVLGVLEARDESDRMITEVAEHWDIARMAAIDRNILRIAVYEMTSRPDIPRKVSINEAIELGKKYSTEQSGAFINGILDRIRRQIEDAPQDNIKG
jgi:transcription antitermination factor NusB